MFIFSLLEMASIFAKLASLVHAANGISSVAGIGKIARTGKIYFGEAAFIGVTEAVGEEVAIKIENEILDRVNKARIIELSEPIAKREVENGSC